MRIPAIVETNRFVNQLPRPVQRQLESWVDNLNTVLSVQNVRVMGRMAPSALRGLFLQVGRRGGVKMQAQHQAYFDFDYPNDDPQMRKLYEKAKRLQWNGSVDLDWTLSVDPHNDEVPLLPNSFIDWDLLAQYGGAVPLHEQPMILHHTIAWMMSQFLHGEQGALLASAQVTEATPSFDGTLFGSTQVMDEARHVEVFNRYLVDKLEVRYQINDNLFTIIDSLMTESRWDMKFLGMQILVEGLALGAFSMLRQVTAEPLLRELLRRVIHDEARHVRYGILTLRDLYTNKLSERERMEREDWAFEIVLLMRNRFLAHELYEQHFMDRMTRRQWNSVMNRSPGMALFRKTMFRRLVPNLRTIGLLTPRMMPKYAAVGLDKYFFEKPTSELSDSDLAQ